MKIAISSDNHLDVNRVDVAAIMEAQAAWLKQQEVAHYFFLGDLFNDFTRTQSYFKELADQLPGVGIHYLAGNHDMIKGASFAEIEENDDPCYFHRRYLDLGANWRVVGNNGWYNYDFSVYHDQPAEVDKWKRVYWLDSTIDQPISDQAREDLVLGQVASQLTAAKRVGKRVLFLTHFAPRHQALMVRPTKVKGPRMERSFQMIRALMGADQLGDLLEASGVVQTAYYGHLHGLHPTFTHGGVTYVNPAVGVNKKRMNEWQRPTFMEQWAWRTKIVDLDKKV